jgi:anti-anti-sigma regulatory factor
VRRAGETPATVVMVAPDGTETLVGCLGAHPADLALVDALARLQLAARRHGLSVRIRDASDDLRALIELAGLAGVLAIEPRRQSELREELGVEEVLQRPDPPL